MKNFSNSKKEYCLVNTYKIEFKLPHVNINHKKKKKKVIYI